jgi:hypothetical protein
MSNPITFVNTYVQNMQQYNQILQTLSGLNDQLTADPTLATRYFQQPGARTDIVAADITNAQSAIVQFLFAFNSGSPTNKSLIYKMFP